MTFKIRKVLASRLEQGKLIYIMWGYTFETLDVAKDFMADFVHPEYYDIVTYNPKRQRYNVVVEHKKAA